FAKDVHRCDPGLILPDMGKHRDARDVADRPDTASRPAALVDLDAALARLDADSLQAEAERPGSATGGNDELRTAGFLAVVELDDLLIALDTHADGPASEHQLDPVPRKDLAEEIADLGILPVGEAGGPLHDRHARAEAGQELTQLDRDDSPTDEHGALGNLRQEIGRAS